ncbi:MAG TPA: ATP-binding protein [Terriglobales bacterium]|nr:ATP-binding protein [Terriglobales bacterium]
MHHSRAAKRVASRQSRKTSALRILRRAVDHCQEVIFLTDADGVLQYVNPSCEIMTGYRADELIGQHVSCIASQVPTGESWDSMRREALQKGVFRGNGGLLSKHGGVVELDLAVTAVRDPGTQVASLAWTGIDVAERELKAKSEGPNKMESLGVFAGGIAHDFNNLLMVIGSYAEMGQATVPADHPARRHMQEIMAAVRRASELTRRLLMFGHRSGAQELVSPNWIVEEAIGMFSRLLEEDIEIRVSLGKDVPLVRVDPGQMEQVLLNLVVNARDAMPNGGELAIETQLVKLNESFARQHPGIAAGEHVLLTVTDSGHGMRAEELARIFEPFYTTKSEEQGTGLGLAIVHSIVQKNGGVISAASTPGAGAAFNIYLPVAAPSTEKKSVCPLPPELPNPRGCEALLVVEDAEPVRQATVEFLSSLGYTVRSAANGEEALNHLQDGSIQFELVMVDIVMPKMSGPELARAIAALQFSSKVLLTSGHPQHVVLSKGVSKIDGNFLQKPFSLKSLAIKIREVLDEPVLARAAAAAAGACSSSTLPTPR